MRRILIVMLAALLAFPLAATSTASALQGTPQASPAGGECVAPEIPPGTPTPMEDMEMDMGEADASPEADGSDPAMEASPEGGEGEMMLPPMQEPLTGEPASDEDIAEAEAAVANLMNCINAGRYVEFASLWTANGLMMECGTSNPYDGEYCFGGNPPIEAVSLENAQVLDDGRIAIDVTYRLGNALQAEQFVFVREGDMLLLDATPDLKVEIPEGATVITGELADFEFVLDQTSAPAGDIAFQVTNTGEYPHEIVVLGLPEGVTIEDIFADESLGEQVQFYGFSWAMPGEEAPPLVMVDMEPGTYTLICFVDEPEGVPHVMRGMILDFEVTEP